MGSNIKITNELEEYINNHSYKLNPIQKEIIKYNETLGEKKKMQISLSQCHLLHLIIKLYNPKKILEIGTYTGYSTICLAEGLSKNGKIDTIDKNEELIKIQNKYFEESGYRNNIIQHTGNALDVLKNLNEKYDIIFIDADKENYINYFNQVSNKLSKNGIIISDNVLWSGKVLDSKQKDEETSTLVKFNKIINQDKRFKSIILPIRDGISISRLI